MVGWRLRLYGFCAHLLRDRRGTTAVEFALVGSAFLGFIFFTVDATWAMAVEMVMNDAVQEASRFASIGTMTTDDVKAKIVAQSAGLLDINNLTVTAQSYGSAYTYGKASAAAPTAGTGSGRQLVQYVVSYKQLLLTPVGIAAVGATITHGTAIMVQNEPF